MTNMTASAAILDFDRLLTPISTEKPCGESLRWDPAWDEISQLRKTRKDLLDSSGDKEPDWDQIVVLTTDVLSTRTKDLLIAGWLTEALLRKEGFAGLRDGLRLIREFVERFWDGLHPLPEDQDLSNRAAPFSWLTSDDGGARLPAMLREVSLTSLKPSSHEDVLNWNFWHQRRAAPQKDDKDETAFKRRNADAEQKRQQFDSAIETTPILVFQTLLADMDACRSEFDLLNSQLGSRLPVDHSPDWTKLKDSLGEIRTFVYGVLKRRGGLPKDADTTSISENQVMDAGKADEIMANSGPIRSRADAMVRLEEVAKFFSDTEPHSPVAYLIRRAIRWAGMPFAEVLGELVKDDKLVKQISETLGIVSTPSK